MRPLSKKRYNDHCRPIIIIIIIITINYYYYCYYYYYYNNLQKNNPNRISNFCIITNIDMEDKIWKDLKQYGGINFKLCFNDTMWMEQVMSPKARYSLCLLCYSISKIVFCFLHSSLSFHVTQFPCSQEPQLAVNETMECGREDLC